MVYINLISVVFYSYEKEKNELTGKLFQMVENYKKRDRQSVPAV